MPATSEAVERRERQPVLRTGRQSEFEPYDLDSPSKRAVVAPTVPSRPIGGALWPLRCAGFHTAPWHLAIIGALATHQTSYNMHYGNSLNYNRKQRQAPCATSPVFILTAGHTGMAPLARLGRNSKKLAYRDRKRGPEDPSRGSEGLDLRLGSCSRSTNLR